MLDQIESWQLSAEKQYDERMHVDGQMECDCGRLFDPESEGGPLSPNPWAMPSCGKCLDDAMADAKWFNNTKDE